MAAAFLIRRLVQAIPVVLGVTVVVFFIIRLVPGDPAQIALGPRATPEAVAQLREEWGLDGSLPTQFADFLGRLAQGDLGTSLTYKVSTSSLIAERLPVTVSLVLFTAILICLIAVPLAVRAASHPGGVEDALVRVVSVGGLALPSFWVGILMIQWLAVRWGWFPAGGWGSGLLGHVRALFLPSLVLALALSPVVVRSLRAEMLKVTQADYVTTARAKGLPERRIRWRHILRNALVPAVAVLTVNLGFLVGGTVVVETIFSLPGLGQLMLKGINSRDFLVVQGVTLVLAMIVIVVTILSDLITSVLDRRIRLS